ncbi:unnamed protein product (mitochondrion) [Plasmodiophora brassicae]|uniref:Uncharacterized protein n=2 Tax=Plasmodiophora brassicae TaxID=37360 RepID=A0A3P3YMA7_PLABS|nr:unnamed protein product [Plasmodiophora brassicae]
MSDAGSDADSEFDLDNFLAAVDGSISVDFDACPNGWAPVNTSELACTLGIDDVDSFLLLHARKEQEKVMQRILQRLPVLSPMLAFINRFIDGLKVTGPELLAFVAMELDLAFYQCSPSRYFSSAKFVKRAGCPSHERYIAILKALGGRHKQRDVDERLCASIGFVPDWSIISADDDHLRLSSHAQVDAAGLQYQKNPVKGAGVVHHSMFRRIEAALMSTWFMAPLKKDHLKIGSLNETNVEHGIRQFVERHGSGLKVVCHKQYGLLCHRRQHEAAFSPDLVAVLHCPQRGAFLSGMEFKTRTSRDTLQTDEALSRVVGAFCRVNVSTDAALFRTAVPNRSYRGQLIHDMSCGGLDDWLFCISSTTRIIRVVHVQINVEDRACYLSSLSFIRERYLMWIYGDEPVPKFDEDEFGHAIDDVTVRQTLQLWRTVTAVVMERGQPLPKGKHILPSLVALWNRIKGGVDVYSRYLKNLHSRHSSLNPVQAIWLRIVMTLVYNAYQSHTMCQVNDFLTNEQACQTFHAYRRARKDQVSFGEFVEAISDEIPKLAGMFEGVTAVIFVTAISDYGSKCFEDDATDRIAESLDVFGQVCAEPMLANAAVILFLNKCDLFDAKLKTVPFANYFDDYFGDGSYDSAGKYLKKRFTSAAESAFKAVGRPDRILKVHFTTAIDRDNVRKVFDDVRKVVQENALKQIV